MCIRICATFLLKMANSSKFHCDRFWNKYEIFYVNGSFITWQKNTGRKIPTETRKEISSVVWRWRWLYVYAYTLYLYKHYTEYYFSIDAGRIYPTPPVLNGYGIQFHNSSKPSERQFAPQDDPFISAENGLRYSTTLHYHFEARIQKI